MAPEFPESSRVLFTLVEMLEQLGIAYQLRGSLASAIHGVPRQTQDIDLVIELDPAQTTVLAETFAGQFFVDKDAINAAVSAKGTFNMLHLASGIKVDFFVRGESPFDRQEFDRTRVETIRENPRRTARIKSPENTILRELHWYQLGGQVWERQPDDVAGVFRAQSGRLDRDHMQQ